MESDLKAMLKVNDWADEDLLSAVLQVYKLQENHTGELRKSLLKADRRRIDTFVQERLFLDVVRYVPEYVGSLRGGFGRLEDR